jgi:hypothetical protein
VLLDQKVDSGSEPIAIDAQVYFPLQFEDTIIELDKALADRSRAFFDRYLGSGLIEVHRTHDDQSGRPRHHAIHLATERLSESSSFQASFVEKLGTLASAPMLIVTPPHQPGCWMALRAAEFFRSKGTDCLVYEHPNLYLSPDPRNSEECELRRMLQSAGENDSLLILDDVCITGTRLSQYQRYVRSEGFKGRIDYLVGIARPNRPEKWTRLQRYLGYRGSGRPRHTVDAVEFILLPDWRDNDCPWCREKRLYERWSMVAPLPDLFVERLGLLSRSMATGLINDLFAAIPGLPEMKLGPSSLFTAERANQAEVFAAVAASLQYLRSEPPSDRPPLGPRHFPVSTVLNHEDYLRSKWTDSILRATFFRAASSDELTYADANRENLRTAALNDLLMQDAEGEHDIALEILLAAGLEKCRVNVAADLQMRLEQFGATEVFSYIFDRLRELQPRR